MMQDVIAKTNTPRSLVDLWKDMQESLQLQRKDCSPLITPITTNPMKAYSDFQLMLDKQEDKGGYSTIDNSNKSNNSSSSSSSKSNNKSSDKSVDDIHDMSEAQISKPTSIEMIEMSISDNGSSL